MPYQGDGQGDLGAIDEPTQRVASQAVSAEHVLAARPFHPERWDQAFPQRPLDRRMRRQERRKDGAENQQPHDQEWQQGWQVARLPGLPNGQDGFRQSHAPYRILGLR